MKLYQALMAKSGMKMLSLSGVSSYYNWGLAVREPFSGAWQKGVTEDKKENILKNSAVFACVTGIASDIAKLRIKLDRNNGGVWEEITENNKWLPVLRKPNHYQTRINFIEAWILSKLLLGNTYILKGRDNSGIVNALYPLCPTLVVPLISDETGDVFYQLGNDYLSGLKVSVTVPASEIIHDRMNCFWHPLIGIPPLYACGMAATMGNKIQSSSTFFFDNRAIPGGVLTAPGTIQQVTADRIKEHWQKDFGGANSGKVAVLGDGLKFEMMQMTSQAAQLEEQLKWTVEDVARAFHYPLFKLGGPVPALAGNIDALNMIYYTDCLQALIESLELCLDEGLALPAGMGTECDTTNLLRMDTASLYKMITEAVSGGGWMKPDEGRYLANFRPVTGGDTPYMQQQNFALSALAKRDAKEDPFTNKVPTPTPTPEPKPAPEPAKAVDEAFTEWEFKQFLLKELNAA